MHKQLHFGLCVFSLKRLFFFIALNLDREQIAAQRLVRVHTFEPADSLVQRSSLRIFHYPEQVRLVLIRFLLVATCIDLPLLL